METVCAGLEMAQANSVWQDVGLAISKNVGAGGAGGDGAEEGKHVVGWGMEERELIQHRFLYKG